MIKIETKERYFETIGLGPDPRDCFIIHYDKDGRPTRGVQFMKPDDMTFEQLYDLNNHAFILDCIYNLGAEGTIKSAFECSKNLVKKLLKDNDIDSLKQWCELNEKD